MTEQRAQEWDRRLTRIGRWTIAWFVVLMTIACALPAPWWVLPWVAAIGGGWAGAMHGMRLLSEMRKELG